MTRMRTAVQNRAAPWSLLYSPRASRQRQRARNKLVQRIHVGGRGRMLRNSAPPAPFAPPRLRSGGDATRQVMQLLLRRRTSTETKQALRAPPFSRSHLVPRYLRCILREQGTQAPPPSHVSTARKLQANKERGCQGSRKNRSLTRGTRQSPFYVLGGSHLARALPGPGRLGTHQPSAQAAPPAELSGYTLVREERGESPCEPR